MSSLERRAAKLSLILDVARSLATERELGKLLAMILEAATEVAEADRCSLFLVDRERGELWTRLAHGVDAGKEIRITLDTGIAGHVARTGEAINIATAYDDPRFNRTVDQLTGYHTESLLTVPMSVASGGGPRQSADESVVGVLQVLNRRDHQPFTAEDQELLEGLGGQAAAAIQNALLSAEIHRLFEGFVQASVGAIEARDPTTAGHSERVARLTVGLARTLAETQSGPYAGRTFTADGLQELRYASLLHDFGKVGVRENVLVKAQKLFPHELSAIRARFDLIRRTLQLESAQHQVELLRPAGQAGVESALVDEQRRFEAALAEVERVAQFVDACNQPNLVAGGDYGMLAAMLDLRFSALDGTQASYLTAPEIERLSIARGSLSEDERREIESHVVHTFEFLKRIPWTRELRRVPEIAHGHHERLDGTGYPLRLGAAIIPVETRMMTIADIYDALTASDRPYKKAVPHERALGILEDEAKRGVLDRDLLTVFIEAKIPGKVLGS